MDPHPLVKEHRKISGPILTLVVEDTGTNAFPIREKGNAGLALGVSCELGMTKKETYTDHRGYRRHLVTRELVHRLVCREVNGHFDPTWHVHHVDGDKKNNHATNLIALPPDLHKLIHDIYTLKKLPRRKACRGFIGRFLRNAEKLAVALRAAARKREKKERRRRARRIRREAERRPQATEKKVPFVPKIIVRKKGVTNV